MRNRAYNVLKNGKIILQNASAAEVRKLLGDDDINVWKYAAAGYKTQGKYIIQDSGKMVERKSPKKTSNTNTIPAEMWKEWTRVCRMFRGIAWQKKY